MATKLKHVAIVSADYLAEGQFYQALFGMTSYKEARPDAAAVSVTDGYVGMNINSRHPGRQAGFDHFGFEVDDAEAIFERLQSFPLAGYLYRPSGRSFAGISVNDPAGNVFDLSKRRMGQLRGVYEESAQSTSVHPRHIKHIALRVLDPALIARFYVEVIGLQQEDKHPEDSSFYLTDGHMRLVLAPWKIADFEGTGICRPAPDHIGFAVDDLAAFQADMERLSARNETIAPREIGRGEEGRKRLNLLRTCRYGSLQFSDPEGVLVDVEAATV